MHRVNRFAIGAAASLAVVTAPLPTFGEPLSDPKEILKRADAAIKQVKTVSYTAKYSSTGWVRRFVADVEGKAVLGPTAEYDVPRFYCEVSMKKKDWDAPRSFTAGCDGNEYFLIDSNSRKAHHDMDPAVMGEHARDIQRVSLREFTLDEPLKDELAAEKVTLNGTKTIDGELCYEIRIDFDNQRTKRIIWWISTEDWLPRGVERAYPPRGDEGEDASTKLTISNVIANPQFVRDPFKLVVPAGYAKTDEFAP